LEVIPLSEIAISVSGLNYEDKNKPRIKDVSFSFSKGGIHGILSPFGSDSSLLLDFLAGACTPSSAEISLDSCVVDFSSDAWKKKIGYVPKKPVFYDTMNVYELLDFVGEARGVSSDLRLRQIEEALELVGLDSLAMRLVGRLSEKEKKRLSLAAALLGNPSFLFFDDPSEELFDLIRLLGKHKTVLLGSGDFATVKELCEDVVILSDGMLLASGSFSELEEKLTQSGENQSLSELYESIVALSQENGKTKSTILGGEEKEQ
jgi:ABC-2 type transport system ATP-binding protein